MVESTGILIATALFSGVLLLIDLWLLLETPLGEYLPRTLGWGAILLGFALVSCIINLFS